MSIFPVHRRRASADGFGHEGPSDAHLAWLNSSPRPGEVLVDTGLSSAVDCQKLRNPSESGKGPEELDREIARMAMLMRRVREADVEVEGARINDLVARTLHRVGLNPERFGVSLPSDTASQGPEGHQTRSSQES